MARFKHALPACYNGALAWFFTFLAFIYTIAAFPLGSREPFQYYGLNPSGLSSNRVQSEPVLLLHGHGGNQACWLSLAKSLQNAGVGPVYTVNMGVKGWESVLLEKIAHIQAQYGKHGKNTIRLNLIGHSLGAIRALQFVYSNSLKVQGVKVNKLISIAGRLKVTKTVMARLIDHLVPIIEKGYRDLQERMYLVDLYTVAAEWDMIVPHEAVFVNCDPSKQHYATNCGHLSVLYSPEVHRTIIEWIQPTRRM